MTKTEDFIHECLSTFNSKGEWVQNSEYVLKLHELLKAQRELCAETFCNQDENVFGVEDTIKNTPEP